MRHALSDLWPSEIRNRPKQGFGVPFSVWLRHPDLQQLCDRIFSKESHLRGLLPGLPTKPTSPDSYQSWLLLTLGVWLENHSETAA
jgi:hypothetical protein